jgi:hypothetical protein
MRKESKKASDSARVTMYEWMTERTTTTMMMMMMMASGVGWIRESQGGGLG